MKTKKICFNISVIILGIFFLASCSGDDEGVKASIELISGETLDLGDVPAGSSGLSTFTVKGFGLTLPISVNISGANMSVNDDLFPAANINNSGEVIFSPELTASQGSVSGIIEFTSGNVSKTINVIANVVEPEGLPANTEIYFNSMEFGLEHGDPVTSSNLEGSDSTDPTVSVSYSLARQGGNESRIRVNSTSSKCDDNAIGDCGNAMRIVGQTTKVTVFLSGLEAGRNYEVSYWIRPDGSSDRSMDVTVTGDTNPAFEDWGGFDDRSFYRQVTRTGVADVSGNLEISFEYSADSTSRTISIDDLLVIAK